MAKSQHQKQMKMKSALHALGSMARSTKKYMADGGEATYGGGGMMGQGQRRIDDAIEAQMQGNASPVANTAPVYNPGIGGTSRTPILDMIGEHFPTSLQRFFATPGVRYGHDNPGQQYAAGGPVRGPGGPTDDRIPAMLSHGEYVMPADTVQAVGKHNLDAVRAATHTPVNKLRGMADGGMMLDAQPGPGSYPMAGLPASGLRAVTYSRGFDQAGMPNDGRWPALANGGMVRCADGGMPGDSPAVNSGGVNVHIHLPATRGRSSRSGKRSKLRTASSDSDDRHGVARLADGGFPGPEGLTVEELHPGNQFGANPSPPTNQYGVTPGGPAAPPAPATLGSRLRSVGGSALRGLAGAGAVVGGLGEIRNGETSAGIGDTAAGALALSPGVPLPIKGAALAGSYGGHLINAGLDASGLSHTVPNPFEHVGGERAQLTPYAQQLVDQHPELRGVPGAVHPTVAAGQLVSPVPGSPAAANAAAASPQDSFPGTAQDWLSKNGVSANWQGQDAIGGDGSDIMASANRATAIANGTAPGQQMRLGYDPTSQIYGTSSKAGGPIDTFTGIGRPGSGGPEVNPSDNLYHPPVSSGFDMGGAPNAGNDRSSEINSRYDTLEKQILGNSSARGKGNAYHLIAELEGQRNQALGGERGAGVQERGQDVGLQEHKLGLRAQMMNQQFERQLELRKFGLSEDRLNRQLSVDAAKFGLEGARFRADQRQQNRGVLLEQMGDIPKDQAQSALGKITEGLRAQGLDLADLPHTDVPWLVNQAKSASSQDEFNKTWTGYAHNLLFGAKPHRTDNPNDYTAQGPGAVKRGALFDTVTLPNGNVVSKNAYLNGQTFGGTPYLPRELSIAPGNQ
jgi:hypothetical protein